MVVGVHLDDVGAGGDLVARRPGHLVGAADFLGALRDVHARLEALGAVGAARDVRLGRDEQARAGDDALVDRLLEPDVGIARALGAEVALGGEAGLERLVGVDHGAGGAQRERLVQHLIVPLGLVVRVEEEVRMALDHAGHQGRARKVDRARAGGSGEVRADRRDPVALDQHRPAFMRCRIDPVEHPRGAEEEGVGERRRGRAEAEQQGGERAKVHEVRGPTRARA